MQNKILLNQIYAKSSRELKFNSVDFIHLRYASNSTQISAVELLNISFCFIAVKSGLNTEWFGLIDTIV